QVIEARHAELSYFSERGPIDWRDASGQQAIGPMIPARTHDLIAKGAQTRWAMCNFPMHLLHKRIACKRAIRIQACDGMAKYLCSREQVRSDVRQVWIGDDE